MASISVISAGQLVEGAVSATEDLLVEGRIDGSVGSTHKVIVAADGYLEASVQAREVVVDGTIVGDLTVTEDVTVTATGQIQGEIRAKRLSLEAGGRVCGLVVT
ncbi:MAG: polymer-forming cytoskeletal protein, partial [Myxococcota bacterium]|nr:polymer-forming cytoskeletal protein [Myxococcota bacterium]